MSPIFPMWPECTTRQRRLEKAGLCFFLSSSFLGRGSSNTSGLFSPSLWYSVPAPASPPRPVRSTPPSALPGFCCLIAPTQAATPCSRLPTFFSFFCRRGVSWWIYKAHMQTVGRVERHLYTQRMRICEREKGGEQATVKLIRTSCVYSSLSLSLFLPPLYLWEALMWLSAWKLNEKCIIAFPFTVSPPFSFLSFPVLSPATLRPASMTQCFHATRGTFPKATEKSCQD